MSLLVEQLGLHCSRWLNGAERCCSCAPEEEKGPKVSSFRNSFPRPLLCQSGSSGTPRASCPMRPGVPRCCLELGLRHEDQVVPGLCLIPDMTSYYN